MLVVTLLFSNLQCNKIISEYDYDVVPIGNVPVDVVNPAVFTFSFTSFSFTSHDQFKMK